MGSGTSTACDISLKTSLSPEQQARFQNSTTIRRILSRPGTVAIVGLSSDPQKASYFVAAYLQKRGWKIIPVSPKPGRILGEESVRDLASIKEPVAACAVCCVTCTAARAIPRRKAPWIFPDASGCLAMAAEVLPVARGMPKPAPSPVRTAMPAPINAAD